MSANSPFFELPNLPPVVDLKTPRVLKAAKELEGNDPGIRTLSGTASVNDATGETIYVPPDDPVAIQQRLTNLETYVRRHHVVCRG